MDPVGLKVALLGTCTKRCAPSKYRAEPNFPATQEGSCESALGAVPSCPLFPLPELSWATWPEPSSKCQAPATLVAAKARRHRIVVKNTVFFKLFLRYSRGKAVFTLPRTR